MKISIKSKLLKNKSLTKKEVSYVQDRFEPKYENGCSLCIVNVLLALGLSPEKAFEVAYKE